MAFRRKSYGAERAGVVNRLAARLWYLSVCNRADDWKDYPKDMRYFFGPRGIPPAAKYPVFARIREGRSPPEEILQRVESEFPGTRALYEWELWDLLRRPALTAQPLLTELEQQVQRLHLKRVPASLDRFGMEPADANLYFELLAASTSMLADSERLMLLVRLYLEARLLERPDIGHQLLGKLISSLHKYFWKVGEPNHDGCGSAAMEVAFLLGNWDLVIDGHTRLRSELQAVAPEGLDLRDAAVIQALMDPHHILKEFWR